MEGGLLKEEDGRYILADAVPTLAIPSSLQASLMARLDRLAPVKEVAQIGAAIGREFSYAVLEAVARRPPDQLRDALDQLSRAGLIFRRGMPPDDMFVFKHAFVQDAAYDMLLRGRRQELHAAIATFSNIRQPLHRNTGPMPESVRRCLRITGSGPRNGRRRSGLHLEAAKRARALYARPEAINHLLASPRLVRAASGQQRTEPHPCRRGSGACDGAG